MSETDNPADFMKGVSADHRAELEERERFWRTAREQLARLKSDPIAWEHYRNEIAELDVLAADGLENEEPYYTIEEEREILANTKAE